MGIGRPRPIAGAAESKRVMLVPPLTVTENIILGNEVTNGLVLDRKRAAKRIRELG